MTFTSKNKTGQSNHDNAANLDALHKQLGDFQNQLPNLKSAMDQALKIVSTVNNPANSTAGASAIEMKTVVLSGKSMRVTLFSDNSIKIEPVAAISAAEVKAIFDTLTA